MKTLLLDLTNWDLVLTGGGEIAAATDPYSVAQDVASAIKVFQGEQWYDTTVGVPYFQQILGKTPSLGFLKAQIIKAALTVPGCTNPAVFITGLVDRNLTGQVQFTDGNGLTQVAPFGVSVGPAGQNTDLLFDSAGNIMLDSDGNLMFGS